MSENRTQDPMSVPHVVPHTIPAEDLQVKVRKAALEFCRDPKNEDARRRALEYEMGYIEARTAWEAIDELLHATKP